MYAIEIFYSEEDEGFIAIVPELPGCSAFGETEEQALKEVKIAMQLWLVTAKEIGREIPVPRKCSPVVDLIATLKMSPGDEFVASDATSDSILLKKKDLRTILNGVIKEAEKLDLDKLERDVEEEGNGIAREKYKILAGN